MDIAKKASWLPAFALDKISEMVIVTDANIDAPGGARIIYVNKALTDLTGYRYEELIGQHPRIFQGEGTDRAALKRIGAALRAGKSVQETVLNYARNGSGYWNQINISPVRDKSKKIAFFLSVQLDVTDEVEAQVKQEKANLEAEILEKQFAAARSAAKIGVFSYSSNEDFQYWSEELAKMTGLPPENVPAPSKVFFSRIHEADRPAFKAVFRQAMERGEGYTITLRFHRPDKRLIHMQIVADVREIEGDRRIIGIARDVTDEVTAAHSLQREKERFEMIADTVSDVLWDYEVDKETWWVSPNWPHKLGLSVSSRGFKPSRWIDYVVEEDRDATRKSILAALKSGETCWQHEFRVADSDGTKVDVEINARILRKSDGWAYRFVGNLRNVTKEKRQREGFTRSRALEAVGEMTGGIAHDFNNLLMIIQGNAEMLQSSVLSEDDREAVEMITQASFSAANLTTRLLSFAGQSRLSSDTIDLNAAIDNLVPLLRAALTSAIEVRTHLPADLWRIRADPGALEQALVNLVVNARDAMPTGGTIHITCENHVVSDEVVGGNTVLPAGSFVCIAVTDSGVGMSEDVIAKACDPFFTTKDVGKGTGLGLSTVYGFAVQSGGGLQIYSEPGKGCTVNLYLPSCEIDSKIDKGTADFSVTPKAKGTKILVVEDEPALLRYVEKLLRKEGYEVKTAHDGNSALEVLKSGNDIDVLFTDVIMSGGMNGAQLAEAARKMKPRIKVLFTSGFPANALDEVGVSIENNVIFLRKPYRSSDLFRELNRLNADGIS